MHNILQILVERSIIEPSGYGFGCAAKNSQISCEAEMVEVGWSEPTQPPWPPARNARRR